MPTAHLKIFLLLLGGLLGPALAVAQATRPAPPKLVNVAVVQTADTVKAAYHRMGQVLVKAGYDLNEANYDTEKLQGTLAYITTIDRNLPARPDVRVALQASVLAAPGGGTAIELRGTYTLDGLHRLPITNRGGTGSLPAATWVELERVADLFPAGTITYRRER